MILYDPYVDNSKRSPYHSFMKIHKILLAAIVTAALFLGCGSKELPEGAVAVVNKTTISEEEFNTELNRFKEQYEAQGMTVSEDDLEMIKPQLLDSLIIKNLLLTEADDLGLTPDEESINSQIDGFKAQMGSEEAFAQALEASGYSEERLRSDLGEQSVVQQLFEQEVYANISISEEDMRTFYDENRDTAFVIPESIEASHILVRVDENQSEEAALDKIQDIKAMIDEGMDFGDAAVQYSEGPSNTNRGVLGQFGRGQMVPEFEEAAFNLEVGTVSEPVLTQFGYHLILTTAKNPEEVMSFDESKQFIEQQMNQDAQNTKTMEYIEKMKDDADIILPEWAMPQEETEE